MKKRTKKRRRRNRRERTDPGRIGNGWIGCAILIGTHMSSAKSKIPSRSTLPVGTVKEMPSWWWFLFFE
jgi:hypothetical protein